MADFHTLPLELSDMVCDFADGHYGVSKNLRLAAKFFYARATKNVFKTLVVYHSPDAYEKINKIGGNAELARYVETLLLPRRQQHAYSDNVHVVDEEGLDFLAAQADLDAWGPELYWSPEEVLASERKWFNGDLQLWKEWMEVADLSKTSAPYVQRFGLHRFPRLKSLESLLRDDLVALNKRKHGDQIGDVTRIEMETHGSSGDYEQLHLPWEDGGNCCGNCTLEFCLFELQRAGKALDNLKLNSFGEISHNSDMQLDLSHLRSLTIDLSDHREMAETCEYYLYAIREPHILALPVSSWFSALTNIDTLSITQPPSRMNVDILRVFKHHRFPKLRNLNLQRVATQDDTLIEFLEAHKETLEALTIDQPLIPPHRWDPLKKDIAELFVSACGHGTSPELTLSDSFDPMTNQTFHHGGSLPSNGVLTEQELSEKAMFWDLELVPTE